MIKYEYKVLKPFTIINDDKGKRIASTEEENNSGSKFTKSASYFDYKDSDENIVQDKITMALEKTGRIKLVNEIHIKRKKK